MNECIFIIISVSKQILLIIYLYVAQISLHKLHKQADSFRFFQNQESNNEKQKQTYEETKKLYTTNSLS